MQSSTIYIPHQLDKNEDRYDFFGGHNCIYIPHQLDKNCIASTESRSYKEIYIPHQLDKNRPWFAHH